MSTIRRIPFEGMTARVISVWNARLGPHAKGQSINDDGLCTRRGELVRLVLVDDDECKWEKWVLWEARKHEIGRVVRMDEHLCDEVDETDRNKPIKQRKQGRKK